MDNKLLTEDREYIKHDYDVPSAVIQLDEKGTAVYSAGCCDCGLVHDTFFIVRNTFMVVVPLRNDPESEKLRAVDSHEFVPARKVEP